MSEILGYVKGGIMLKRADNSTQPRRTPHAVELSSTIVSDDLLLMSESVVQERSRRLRDLIDSLALEGERIDVQDLIRMTQETHAEIPLSLTARERDVLLLLATGASNCKIAEMLKVTVNTVKTHLNGLYNKLNVHSRVEAIAQARRLDLL